MAGSTAAQGSATKLAPALSAIRYRTELERLGADVFDAQYSGFNAPLISPYFSGRTNWSGGLGQHPLYSSGAVDRELVPYNADDPTTNLLPGDHVYFKNHPAYGESGLWMGEHAMYIGGGLFVGFGASSIETITYADGEKVDHHKYAVTYDQMIEELRKQLREVNSDKSLDPIGLEDPENPGMIRVRRPKAPFLASE